MCQINDWRFYQMNLPECIVVLPQSSVTVISTVCVFPLLNRVLSMENDNVDVLPSSSNKAKFPSILPMKVLMPLRSSVMRNFTVPFLHDFWLIGVIFGGVVSVVTVNVPNASGDAYSHPSA